MSLEMSLEKLQPLHHRLSYIGNINLIFKDNPNHLVKDVSMDSIRWWWQQYHNILVIWMWHIIRSINNMFIHTGWKVKMINENLKWWMKSECSSMNFMNSRASLSLHWNLVLASIVTLSHHHHIHPIVGKELDTVKTKQKSVDKFWSILVSNGLGEPYMD